MASSLRCAIVTPSESVLDVEATYATFPAWDGQVGVLPDTSPFLTRLGAGAFEVETGGKREVYILAGGFAQMQNGVLTLLADVAAPAATVNLKDAEAELAAANAKVTQATGTTLREREAIEGAQRLASAKVALARRAR